MEKHLVNTDLIQPERADISANKNPETAEAITKLQRGIYAALETYSNVHRGSGHYSMATTHLYERAREIVLEFLGLNGRKYVVIFCTPAKADALGKILKPGNFQVVSDRDIGLALGMRALVVKRNFLPRGIPFQTGGGTTRLVSPGWVIWAKTPDKFEAGTPSIINVIAFAKALLLVQQSGKNIFRDVPAEPVSVDELLYRDELEEYSGKELLQKLRQSVIGSSIRVPTSEGEIPFTNLDNSASTPTFTPVWDTFRKTILCSGLVHQEIVREVKLICSRFLGAPSHTYDMIFTSNTTEAINLAARNLSCKQEEGIEPIIVTTLLEHSSNDLPWRTVTGHSLIRFPVNSEGFINLIDLENLLRAYNENGQFGNKRIRLMVVTGASNVLGTCNNLEKISRIVHKYGARLLVDAAQLVAHRKIDMEGWGIDYLAFSAHKIYAPFGSGLLVVRKGLMNTDPVKMNLIRSSGEENPGGIAALGKALILLQRIGMNLIREEEKDLTRMALNGLSKIKGLRIFGIKDPDSPEFDHKLGVVVFSMKGRMPSRVARELAEISGIGVRYGCHCAHILIKHLLGIGPVPARIQGLIVILFPKFNLPGLVRVSLGIENSPEDIHKLLQALEKITKKHSASGIKEQINTYVVNTAARVYS